MRLGAQVLPVAFLGALLAVPVAHAHQYENLDTSTYSVTYDGNGNDSGTAPIDENAYPSGYSVTVVGNTGGLVKEGYVFSGWNSASDGSGSTLGMGDAFTITGDVTLYAQWEAQDPMARSEPEPRANPGLANLFPADDIYHAAPRLYTLVATFDMPITLVNGGTITVTDLDDGTDTETFTLPDARVTSPNGNDLSIEMDGDLEVNTHYSVRISPDAVQDAGSSDFFAGIADDTTWNFRTVKSLVDVVIATIALADAEPVKSISGCLDVVFNDAVNVDEAMRIASYGEFGMNLIEAVELSYPELTVQEVNDNGGGGYIGGIALDDVSAARFQMFAMPSGVSGPTGSAALGGTYSRYQIFSIGVVMHELGHCLGGNHSMLGSQEYGNHGCALGGYSYNFGAHKKIRFGWLNNTTYPGSIVDVSTSTNLTLVPLEQNPETLPGTRVARVSRFDGLLYSMAFRVSNDPYRSLEALDNRTIFIDLDLGSSLTDLRSTLAEGESYTDGAMTVTCNSIAPDGNSADIAITIAEVPEAKFTVTAPPPAYEGTESTYTATVALSFARTDTVVVEHALATSPGTATIDADYTYTPGTLTFAPGERSKTFTFDIINDTDAEPDETIVFDLAVTSGNATVGSSGTLTYTITDEDGGNSNPPSLVSIVDQFYGTSAAVGVPINFLLTFDESINGATLGTDDFENGATTSPATITVDSVTATANPKEFLVSVTPTSSGNLSLQLKAGAVIEDLGTPTPGALDTATALTGDTTISVATISAPWPTINLSTSNPDPLTLPVGDNSFTYTLPVDFLIVAGGGGGGAIEYLSSGRAGGGGGAGGMIQGSTTLNSDTYNIAVGAGGVGVQNDPGTNGGNSSMTSAALDITAIGGGGGGDHVGNGRSGGSGGGGGGSTKPGGSGTPGQGNDGGDGVSNLGGGGGGAGGLGQDGIRGGAGGAGRSSLIVNDSPVTYATGGAGATTSQPNSVPDPAAANTGNGGKGADIPNAGGSGGSGIVVVRYTSYNDQQLLAGGDSVGQVGGDWVHQFTNPGASTLEFASGLDATITGNIDGSGNLIWDKGDTLTLSGANTYTGATTVSNGTLALVGGSQTSPITVESGASLRFTLGSPTTSTAALTLNAGHTIAITGTVDYSSDYQLMTCAGITGTPTLDAPITAYALELRNGNTELWLAYTPDQIAIDLSTGIPNPFTLSGGDNTFTFTLSADYLIVAGGGGGGDNTNYTSGGYRSGGGGGAGGLLQGSTTLAPATFNIAVGAGGVGVANDSGTDGGNSSMTAAALDLTAIGGGGGGNHTADGRSGGAGGGGGGDKAGGTGTEGQGNAGGTGISFDVGSGNTGQSSGGGGGAGGAGQDGSSGGVAAGGAGLSSSIVNDSSVTYATGGTGANNTGPVDAAANTGNGGGGSSLYEGTGDPGGGVGGSGIVVVRYTSYNGQQLLTGGDSVGQVGGDWVHQFTTTGASTLEFVNAPITGNIDGSGNLIWDKGVTLTLSGTNTYTGTTTVTNGSTLALVGGSQASPITVASGASLRFTLGSPTTSTAGLTLDDGHMIAITGTVDNASDYLLMTCSGITGTPTLDAPITDYELELRNGNTELWLVYNPLTLGSTSPADNATDVFLGTRLVATFSEPIQLTGAGSMTITGGSSPIHVTLPDDVTIDGTVLTIHPPAKLELLTEYEVVIDGNAIENQATDYQKAFAGTTSGQWTFTTFDPANPSFIYYDDFSGDTSSTLVGTAPDARPGTETWGGDSAAVTAGGTFGHQWGNARLPFTPQAGNIYELSAVAAALPSGGEFAFGFDEGNNTSAIHEVGDTFYARVTSTIAILTDRLWTSNSSHGSQAISAGDTVSVIFDARKDSSANWTIGLMVNGVTVVSGVSPTHADLGDIRYVSIHDNPYFSGTPTIDDFTLRILPALGITSLSPADDAVNVAVDTNLVLTFPEDVKAGTGTIVLKKASDDSTVQTFDVTTDVTFSGTQVIIDPASDLEPVSVTDPGVGYYVLIDADAILSAANDTPFGGFDDPTDWNFYTAGAPTLVGLSPADDATGVAVATSLMATFNEPVSAGAGFVTIKKTSDDSTVQSFNVASEVTFDGSTLTVTPSSSLALNTGYYVTIDSGAVVSVATGKAFAGIADTTTWNFRTESITVAYWQLDEASGSLVDVVGTRNLTGASGLTYSQTALVDPVPNPDEGPFSSGTPSANPNSILFPGSHTGPKTTDAALLTAVKITTTNSFTFEGWLQTTTTASQAVIAGDRHSSTGWKGWYFLVGGSTGKLQFYSNFAAAAAVFSDTVVNDGNPHHFAIVWDHVAGEMRLYVDGTLEDSVSQTPGSYTQSAGFAIGARATSSDNVMNDDRFAGNLDELRLSKVALAPEEFLLPGSSTSTVTYDGNGSDGGSVPVDGSSPYANGATVTVLGNTGGLTKAGSTFAGWNTSSDGLGTAYAADDTFTITRNTTLYAQWTSASSYATYASQNGGSTTDPTADGNNNGIQDGVEYAFYEALGTGVKLESPGQLGQVLWGTLDAMGTPNDTSDDHIKYSVLLPATPPADVIYLVYASSVAPGDQGAGKTLLATYSGGGSGYWTAETGVNMETGAGSEDVIVDTETPSSSTRRFVWLELEITGL